MDKATRAPGIEALSNTTRLELAHRLHAEAVEKLRRLETDVEAAFEAYEKVKAELATEGVDTEVRLRPPLAAARREFLTAAQAPTASPEQARAARVEIVRPIRASS